MQPQTPPRPKKIAIIGAGNIGTKLWEELTTAGMAEHVAVYNRSEDKFNNDKFAGMARAVDQSTIIAQEWESHAKGEHRKKERMFSFTSDLEEAFRGADIVIVTAGLPRKEGQSREALLAANCAPIDEFAKYAHLAAHDATFIIATNPVDTMTQRFQEKSGIPANRVVGLSGVLDRARMVQSISDKLNVPHRDVIGAQVVGQHGDNMVPVISQTRIRQANGSEKPLSDFPEDVLASIKADTKNGGGIMIKLLGTSDWTAPAAALFAMTKNIIAAKYQGRSDLPPICCSAYSPDGVYIGQPIQFQANGTYKTTTPHLSHSERKQWRDSVKAIQADVAKLPDREPSFQLAV